MKIVVILFCIAFFGHFAASMAMMVVDPKGWKKAWWIERGLLDRYDVDGNEDDRRTVVRLGATVLILLTFVVAAFLANLAMAGWRTG